MHPGQRISQYEIIEELGQGGMGVVYKAHDTKLDRTVALKFLPPKLSSDPQAKQRFIREAKAASALDHANICTIHDIAETEDGELYIVMAYYEGQILGDLLQGGELSVDRCVDIALQVARALERAHDAGIVHRDVKPANIMVTDRGEVKLLDFGVAKLMSGQDLTRTGASVGTVAYMSPEQIDAQKADGRTDLWSLGVVLYEMLTGRVPFGDDSAPAVMYAILEKEPAPLSDHRSDIPDDVMRIVAECLAKDRDDRPQSAGVVSDVLSARQAGAGAPRRPGRAGRKPIVLGSAALALLVAAVLYVAMSPGSSEPGAFSSTDVIAVVPFTVRGSSDLAYLGEGIVDLLSAKLDGAGTLTAVNPRVVISLVSGEGVDVSDPAAGRRLAQRLGAGLYVTGDLLELAGRITLTAYLHDTRQADSPVQQATIEGSTEELFEVIDGLVTDLLAGSMSGPVDRLLKLATVTSASLPATKEYLQGERLLRDGLYREAAHVIANA
jgi:serine/threonine protein kinase